jgi:hypothetical protein
MRLPVVLILVGLVLLCPAICGAADAAQGAHRHQAPSCPGEDPSTPAHCPEEGATCLCEGAVRTAEVRSNDLDPVGTLSFGVLLADCCLFVPARLSAHLTHGGRPLASGGDASAVCALLQIFRC